MQVVTGTFGLPAHLPLEHEDLLLSPEIAYQTYGKLSGGNAILLLHGLLPPDLEPAACKSGFSTK